VALERKKGERPFAPTLLIFSLPAPSISKNPLGPSLQRGKTNAWGFWQPRPSRAQLNAGMKPAPTQDDPSFLACPFRPSAPASLPISHLARSAPISHFLPVYRLLVNGKSRFLQGLRERWVGVAHDADVLGGPLELHAERAFVDHL